MFSPEHNLILHRATEIPFGPPKSLDSLFFALRKARLSCVSIKEDGLTTADLHSGHLEHVQKVMDIIKSRK